MKTLFFIAMRSLRQHALSTLITAFSVALACGLMMGVFAINTQTQDAFIIDDTGFDAIVGARGSKLQLVLNTMYHLETSPGNIPWSMYQELANNGFMVRAAIPYAVGDNYKGYRMVGTTATLFDDFEYREGKVHEFADGAVFDSEKREAVLGSFVAHKTGLKVGDSFNAFHGLTYDPALIHEGEFTVAGVLKPTNTPTDRVIWTPIDSVFRMEGHVLRGGGTEFQADATQEIPDEHKEVSAIMLKLNGDMSGMMLSQGINHQGKDATMVWPIAVTMLEFFEKVGWMHKVLQLVSYLVVLVAAGGILASIYNTMNERRREFAIMRALGARRRTVFSVIVLQSALIALLGALMGFAVYAVIVAGAARIIREQVGVHLAIASYHPILWIAPAVMLGLGIVAGVVPAIKAYRTDVAANLTPST
ncbi:MAG: putative ABC transport system permease protein [Rhodothermales bacterium]|jgi:putative ABC transport system permease protein